MALRAVADESERVIFEVVLQPGKRPVAALVDDLWAASKVERLYAADGLQGPTKKKKKERIKRRSPRDEGNFGVKAERTSTDVAVRRGTLATQLERDASNE